MAFTLIIIKYWISNDFKIVHSNPAWFIPIVGNMLVPVVGVDAFSLFLYFIALFTLLLLLFIIKMYDVKQFFISWWAYTFPLAAISIATLMLEMAYHNALTYIASLVLMALTTLVVGFVTYKTMLACKAHSICISEEE